MRIDADNTITDDQRHLAKCRQRSTRRRVATVTWRRRTAQMNALSKLLRDRLFGLAPAVEPDRATGSA